MLQLGGQFRDFVNPAADSHGESIYLRAIAPNKPMHLKEMKRKADELLRRKQNAKKALRGKILGDLRKEKQKETSAKKRAEVCFFIYVLTLAYLSGFKRYEYTPKFIMKVRVEKVVSNISI